jgi:hypothetical protein
MQCFQNALDYFAMALSYGHKMFMKLATDRTQRRPEEEEKRSLRW